ncbi:MAG: class I SAM-dependent methyltransferase [Candidatus Kariarchaeaceae archaeon]
MKIKNTYDVESLLKMYVSSSALQLSLIVGLFYDIENNPQTVEEISKRYDIPHHRTRHWLNLLKELDLLEQQDEKFYPSNVALIAILKPYSKESWALLADVAYNRYLIGNNLVKHISHPQSVLKDQRVEFPNWFASIIENKTYARDFTITLYERHLEFAEEFSKFYDMTGIKKIMDIGGGSGVMSLELLKKNAELQAVVIDVENVCKVGREIADKSEVGNRIEYQVVDFEKEPLPTGFDAILLCDSVSIPKPEFSEKLKRSLNLGGRVIYVHNLDSESSWFTYEGEKSGFQRANNIFLNSLCLPSMRLKSVDDLKSTLQDHKFTFVSELIMENGGLIVHGFVT